jgi:GNAT superfamily N-acetyltransferase
MYDANTTGLLLAKGSVRKLSQQEELPLLRNHLLRLDRQSRYDRFHGFIDDDFIQRYAAKCATDGTVIIAYIEGGEVRGAAELHPPDRSPGALPEIAFSVEASMRCQGVGSILFRALIDEARRKGYKSLLVTTGADNQAMRALARKFGAHLTFRHGESTGSVEISPLPQREPSKSDAAAATSFEATHAVVSFNRAYRKMLLGLYGWGRAA